MFEVRVFGRVIALLLFGPALAFADAGRSSLKIPEAVRQQKFEEDRRITDIELKAQAGSLSRYSLKFDLSFQGPPVADLHEPNMPNPDNRPRPNRTSLSGYTGLRYRINPSSAMNVSTGVKWYSPYQQVTGDDTKKPQGEEDYEVANPQVSYDRTYPFRATQMRSSIKASYITQDYYQERGQWGALGYTQAVKYQPARGRLILGMAIDGDWFFYGREYRPRWDGRKTGDGRVSNYYLTFIPSLEYKITDRLNFKSSIGYSYANLRQEGSGWNWAEQLPMGRAGVGWAITREIYFYPYLNFFTKSPSIASTSLSASTVFSIF